MVHLTRITIGDLANLVQLIQNNDHPKIEAEGINDRGNVTIFGQRGKGEFIINYGSGMSSIVSGNVGKTKDDFLYNVDQHFNRQRFGLCEAIYVPKRSGIFVGHSQYLEGRLYQFD